jgi:hypothetical protein
MKYVCLCYDEEAKLNAMSEAELDDIMREVHALQRRASAEEPVDRRAEASIR